MIYSQGAFHDSYLFAPNIYTLHKVMSEKKATLSFSRQGCDDHLQNFFDLPETIPTRHYQCYLSAFLNLHIIHLGSDPFC
jgi:hypothetical protein